MEKVKCGKSKNGGYMHNCHLEMRAVDKCMFTDFDTDTGDPIATLNGYAIIPIEKYYELAGIEFTEKLNTQIEAVDKCLNTKS